MQLDNLNKVGGNARKSKRVGRGVGSGKGSHSTGSGIKGQKSRQGNSLPFAFEGGQVPLYKKLPQIQGFKNPTAKKVVSINLDALNKFTKGSEVTPESLVSMNIVKFIPRHGIKVLATGKLDKDKNLTLSGLSYSASALKAIEASGCTIK